MSAPRVYVGKIPDALADDAIVERALEICGALKSGNASSIPTTRAPKRFGFATFETIEGAVRCAARDRRAARGRGGRGDDVRGERGDEGGGRRRT